MATYPTNSSFAEAYRTLRTNIQFSSLDKRLRSFVLTSALAKEGKTLTAANTAYALAQTGKSVLMVDIDLRKPSLSSLFPSDDTPGLTGLLSGVFSTEVSNGSLSDLQIGDLFRLLGMQKKSGVLSLSQVNEQIELLFYQGKLVDPASGNPVAPGGYVVQFRVYDQPTLGTLVWGRAFAVNVITNGMFNVLISDGGIEMTAPAPAESRANWM